MNEINKLNIESIFTIIIDLMQTVEKSGIYTGSVKKKFVLDKLQEYVGEDFPVYKTIFENVIDGIVYVAKNRKILKFLETNKNLCCF